MRKAFTSLALGCALALTLSAAASACEYYKQQTQASAGESAQTAQAPPAAATD